MKEDSYYEEIASATTAAHISLPLGEGRGGAVRVAIQGVRGAFHEIAARRYFGDSPNLKIVEATTFDDLVDMTLLGEVADGALMAIENTIAGSLIHNYNLLNNNDLYIKGEVYLRIVQNLIVTPGVRIEDLTEVYSHPVALAQCVNFFKNYPHIKLIEATDTALSVKMIKEKGMIHAGAVASSLAAELYEMELLVASIEDYKKNYTRFLVLSPSPIPTLPKREGERWDGAKCSVVFTLKHEVGSLHLVLATLAEHQANLTKIESIPIPDEPWHYRFFVAFTFDSFERYELIMKGLDNLVESYKVLGVYQKGKYWES
jgi:prephenate dehydratase